MLTSVDEGDDEVDDAEEAVDETDDDEKMIGAIDAREPSKYC